MKEDRQNEVCHHYMERAWRWRCFLKANQHRGGIGWTWPKEITLSEKASYLRPASFIGARLAPALNGSLPEYTPPPYLPPSTLLIAPSLLFFQIQITRWSFFPSYSEAQWKDVEASRVNKKAGFFFFLSMFIFLLSFILQNQFERWAELAWTSDSCTWVTFIPTASSEQDTSKCNKRK